MNELFVLRVGEKTASNDCIIIGGDLTLYTTLKESETLWSQEKWMII